MSAPQLLEQDRVRLDGIVSKMIENGESDEDIQFVVNDFKQKYAGQPREKQGVVVPFTPFRVQTSPQGALKAIQEAVTRVGKEFTSAHPGTRVEQFGPGSIPTSTHKTGTGLDLRGPNLPGYVEWAKSKGAKIVIYNHAIWKRQPDGSYKQSKYTGPSPHTDHVHIDWGGQAPAQGPVQGPKQSPRQVPKQKSGLDIVADALRKPEYAPKTIPASVPPKSFKEAAERIAKGEVIGETTEAQKLATQIINSGKLSAKDVETLRNVSRDDPDGATTARVAMGMKGVPDKAKKQIGKLTAGSTQRQFQESGMALPVDDPKQLGSTITEIAGKSAEAMGAPSIVGEILSYWPAKTFYGLSAGLKAMEGDIAGAGLDAAQTALPDVIVAAVPRIAKALGTKIAAKRSAGVSQAEAVSQAIQELPVADQIELRNVAKQSPITPKVEPPTGLPGTVRPKKLTTQPTPSGVSQKAKRNVKPVVKPVEGKMTADMLTDEELVDAAKRVPQSERATSPIWKEYDSRRNEIRANQATDESTRTQERSAKAHASFGGFTDSMSAPNAAKAKGALNQPTKSGGVITDRKTLIEEKVAAGYTVQVLPNGKRRLVSPSGSYLEESAITKTGMDYADFLAKKPTPPTPPKAESSKGAKEPWTTPFESAPIPDGMVRRFHVTNADPSVIAREGLKYEHAKGIEGPRAIYSFDNLKDAQNYAGSRPIVEFWEDPKTFKDHPQAQLRDVKPEQITTVRYKWHDELDGLKSDYNSATPENRKSTRDALEEVLRDAPTGSESPEIIKYRAFRGWIEQNEPNLSRNASKKPTTPKAESSKGAPLESIGGSKIPEAKTPNVVPESRLKEALKDASAERQAAFDALQKARAKQNAARRGGKKSGAAAPVLPEEIAYAKTWLKEKGLQAASAVEDFVNHMIDLGYDRATAKRILKASSDPETGAPTGLARQFEDVERKVLGLEPTRKPAQSAETLAEIGKDLSPQAASYVESSVVNNRALEPAEVAAVAHYKRGLANEYKELGTRLRNGDSSVLGRMTDIEREFDKISTAAQNTRTKWHDLGESLQVAFDPGYSRVDLKTRALRANQGEALSKKQSDEIDRVATRNEVADESLSQSRKSLTVEDVDEIDTLRKEVADLKKQLEDKKATQTARQSSDRPRKMRANALGVLQKYGIKTAPIESTATRKVSKQAGFINIPVNGGDDITRAIRSLVRSYILDADKITLDEILTKLKTDVPGLDEDQALMILSNKYRTKLLEADVAKLDAERALREIVRDAEFRQKSTAGKAVSLSGNLLTATARGLQAGLDLSAPLIQGLPMLMQGSKVDWIKAWKPMFQAAFAKGAKGGEEFAMLVNAEIKRHPMYARARKAGLDLTEMAGAFERQEEFFAGDLIETLSKSNIPGLKQYAQAIVRSNAAFNVFNNKARFDTFVRFAKLNPDDPDFLKDAAMMVNILSGRGSGEVARMLGSKAAGNVFYAPRFAWSGWQNASGVPVMFANTKLGRQVAIQNYAKGGAFMAITLGAASVSPFVKSVDTDIRSTNFGAITFKDGTQINPFARILQPYRTVAQAAFGRVSRAGNYTDPTDVEAQAKFGGGYLLNKLSPAARLVFTGFSGTMYDSDKEEWVAAEPGKLAIEAITPMSWRNLFGSMSQKDATLIGKILSTGALLGMDTRRESTKKAQSPAPPMNFLPEGWRVLLGQRPLKQGESSAPKGAQPVSGKVGLPAEAKPVK